MNQLQRLFTCQGIHSGRSPKEYLTIEDKENSLKLTAVCNISKPNNTGIKVFLAIRLKKHEYIDWTYFYGLGDERHVPAIFTDRSVVMKHQAFHGSKQSVDFK